MDKPKQSKKEEIFSLALHEIEHALSMYATRFITIPASKLYDKKALELINNGKESFHIYLIGYTPRVEFVGAKDNGSKVSLKLIVKGSEYTVKYDLPEGFKLKNDKDVFYLEDITGQKYDFNKYDIQMRLNRESQVIDFEVKYIGQAYGKDGSRVALERLLSHKTLQKIAVMGGPEGYILTLLMLEIQPNNQIFTAMNPFAKKLEEGTHRIRSGLNKLFNTTEQERIALFEASFIRYFKPEFNKIFKGSFPSTNLNILRDCYVKDFSAVVAEICIDELPFRLYSQDVPPDLYHIAHYNLHEDENRRMFFGIK